MADKLLESSAISAFCSSVATMLAAGVQTDEAVHMLSENREKSYFKTVCDRVYTKLIEGVGLAEAMRESGAFPNYAVEMVHVGESAGRTERVLRSLGHYYDSEGRSFNKLKNSVSYPAALLCIMSVILAFTVIFILPTFANAYKNMSSSLTDGSSSMIAVSMVIGGLALAIVLIATLIALYITFCARSSSGRERVLKIFERFGATKQAMYQLAISRFTNALSSYIASGVQEEQALKQAMDTVDHPELTKKLQGVYSSMTNIDNPRNLAQAIVENDLFEPIYGRMLLVGTRSGATDEVLAQLADTYFEDANAQVDAAIDRVEPALAAFLTVAVGATLIAVMLPLIGIMGSIA